MRERIANPAPALTPPTPTSTPTPGHFLAEGGPRRQTIAWGHLGQAHKEESPGVWVAGAGNGFLGRHSESESSWGKKLRAPWEFQL